MPTYGWHHPLGRQSWTVGESQLGMKWMTSFPINHLHAVSGLDCGGQGSRKTISEITAVLGARVSAVGVEQQGPAWI